MRIDQGADRQTDRQRETDGGETDSQDRQTDRVHTQTDRQSWRQTETQRLERAERVRD